MSSLRMATIKRCDRLWETFLSEIKVYQIASRIHWFFLPLIKTWESSGLLQFLGDCKKVHKHRIARQSSPIEIRDNWLDRCQTIRTSTNFNRCTFSQLEHLGKDHCLSSSSSITIRLNDNWEQCWLPNLRQFAKLAAAAPSQIRSEDWATLLNDNIALEEKVASILNFLLESSRLSYLFSFISTSVGCTMILIILSQLFLCLNTVFKPGNYKRYQRHTGSQHWRWKLKQTRITQQLNSVSQQEHQLGRNILKLLQCLL